MLRSSMSTFHDLYNHLSINRWLAFNDLGMKYFIHYPLQCVVPFCPLMGALILLREPFSC